MYEAEGKRPVLNKIGEVNSVLFSLRLISSCHTTPTLLFRSCLYQHTNLAAGPAPALPYLVGGVRNLDQEMGTLACEDKVGTP